MKTAKQLQDIANKTITEANKKLFPLLEKAAEDGQYRYTRVDYFDDTSVDQLSTLGFRTQSTYNPNGDTQTLITWAHFIENTKGLK